MAKAKRERIFPHLPAVAASANVRDEIIEDYLVNAIECLADGDSMNDRDRLLLTKAFERVAVRQMLRAERDSRASTNG